MRLALTVLAIAGLLAGPVTAPVLAQDQEPGAPLRLVAPTPLPDKEKPADKPAEATPAGIGATDLGPLDPSWGDALPKGEAALPNDMWTGTSRSILRGLLPLLGPTDSPAARALARRLLLSGGAVPLGADPADQPSLAMLRAQALARLGDFAGARSVLDNFPADRRGEPAERLRIELAFASGDIADACKRVADGLAAHKNAWWDQGNIACQLLQGHREQAALSLDVLHDSGAEPDPLFDTLVAAASGKQAKLEKKTTLTPMRALLWGAGRRPLPADVLATADVATLAAYASGKAAPQYRLAPAERAASFGAWPPEKLAELYGKMKFTDDERAGALALETIGDLPAGRALLFSIAQADSDPARRIAALLRFLGAAQQHDLFFAAACMAAPIVATIGPSPATKEAAPFFIRALIAADRVKDIAPWLPLLDSPMPLVTIVHVIDGARPDDKAMEISLAGLLLRSSSASFRQIDLYLMLANEYGTPPSASELAGQMARPRQAAMPSTAVWLDLQRAVASHRLAETILASLVLAQDGAHVATEALVVQRAVASLRAAAGLDAEARALARDAAVASGM